MPSSHVPPQVPSQVPPRLSSQVPPQQLPPQLPPSPPSVPSKPRLRQTLQKTLKNLSSATPHENIYTIPNILTFSRLLAAPVIGYLVLHDQHAWAFGLFAYAGLTDLVDGWIARRFNQQTVVGTVIDPMADKSLMTILTVCLGIQGGLPWWCATVIVGRDVLLAISAIYYRYISLPPPKTFARFWDFSLPSAEVHPTAISKVNTALQLGLIGWTVGMPLMVGWAGAAGYGGALEIGLMGMQHLVVVTTVWSGASYLYSTDAVKILSHKDIEQREKERARK